MQVTIFKDFEDKTNPFYIDIHTALDRIRNGKVKPQIDEIRRKASAGEDYSLDKKKLPFVEFSAAKTKAVVVKKERDGKPIEYTSNRLDESIVEHSGLFILDFDKIDVAQKAGTTQTRSVHLCLLGSTIRYRREGSC
jgi:hypothetical protein